MDTKANKRTGPQFSAEMRTSQRAIFQLADRLTEAWWKVESPAIYPDTGEDVRVEIFEPGGARTGLSLDFQVKGHEGIERFLAKGDPAHVHYQLDVMHLESWEKKPRPVAILIWDVRERRGYWALARDACKRLDTQSPRWRQHQYATLLIHRTNITDDEGLARLREAVAWDELPKLVRPGDEVAFELSVQPDDSPEGRAKENELIEFWEGGGEVTIESRLISDLVMLHDGLRRAFGDAYWKRAKEVQLFSVPGRKLAPVRVEAESAAGTAQLPYVELRLARSGRRYSTLSNEHQRAAVTLKLVLDDGDPQLVRASIELALDGRGLDEARAAAWFVLMATEPGGSLRIERLDERTDPCVLPFYVSVTEEERASLRRTHELLQRLSLLQERVRTHGHFSFAFPPSRQQVQDALKLLPVVSGGEHEMTYRANISVKGTSELSIAATDGPLTFVHDGDDAVEVFGVRVPIGPVRFVITDVPHFVESYNSALRQALASRQDTFHVDIPCRGRYLDWAPEGSLEDRLDALAKDQAGYFTADQARSVGCFADYLDYLEQRKKLETVAEGVFRLVNFPAVSDVKDLVVVWLQSGKAAVFSHHTALVLHELSDILPPRIHVTVPPTWTPAAPLPAHVVLHSATLAESEITWHDVVPITTPARTIRDCRAAGLDPELLEQACREGIERGIIPAEALRPSEIFAAE
ncbi:hypothetical protein BE20_11185 [Sorangium cellulosum]|uniref:DUF4365 domain-containing protein n=1 Tax=Sorangium cellulosum TaxID=56 RepID=A0A150RJW4_SORCE|nr:hypothetical protein BE18_50770 [Sorangium cellulosum]KYF92663.1 hypothetical protein BE20_11185 [Sorangium cellulosum]